MQKLVLFELVFSCERRGALGTTVGSASAETCGRRRCGSGGGWQRRGAALLGDDVRVAALNVLLKRLETRTALLALWAFDEVLRVRCLLRLFRYAVCQSSGNCNQTT